MKWRNHAAPSEIGALPREVDATPSHSLFVFSSCFTLLINKRLFFHLSTTLYPTDKLTSSASSASSRFLSLARVGLYFEASTKILGSRTKPNSQARTGARKFSPVQLTINRIGNLTQLICTLLYVMTTHTCIRILYCRVYPQLPPVIGAPWGLKKNLNAFVAGTIFSPRPLWFGGCATHATPCSVPGYSYFRMCLEKSEHKLLVQCSNPREFFFYSRV